jgi:acyl-[acyl-carrier-protein]-phospholipid O-acyltransferase/long-chain-fatty-acid--[acyl-carrier-protein] ligase
VTAVPDEGRGERLVVLHTALDKTPADILKELKDKGLPNLWLPSADSFAQVEQIPILGTGKLDLKALKQTALEKFGKK